MVSIIINGITRHCVPMPPAKTCWNLNVGRNVSNGNLNCTGSLGMVITRITLQHFACACEIVSCHNELHLFAIWKMNKCLRSSSGSLKMNAIPAKVY